MVSAALHHWQKFSRGMKVVEIWKFPKSTTPHVLSCSRELMKAEAVSRGEMLGFRLILTLGPVFRLQWPRNASELSRNDLFLLQSRFGVQGAHLGTPEGDIWRSLHEMDL